MRAEPPRGGAGRMLARKPTRRASSANEVLRRTCLRCTNEWGPEKGETRQRGALQGRTASGANRTAEAA
eukprot:8155371-Alexandrium_andersonii.AAC.1